MKLPPRIIALLSLASLSLLASGCASIVKGTTQLIPVSSDPTGAQVRLDGNNVGSTPTSVEVKRKGDHLMTIEKSGYKSESVAITRNIGGAVYGNILAGGLIGWGVDAISGAQYNLSPATINVSLTPLAHEAAQVTTTDNGAVKFISELRTLDELHEGKKITDEEYAKMRTGLVAKYSGLQPQAPAATPAPSTPATQPTFKNKLGLEVVLENDRMVVANVMSDSAAANAGIQKGDQIFAYNGQPDGAVSTSASLRTLISAINSPLMNTATVSWKAKDGADKTAKLEW